MSNKNPCTHAFATAPFATVFRLDDVLGDSGLPRGTGIELLARFMCAGLRSDDDGFFCAFMRDHVYLTAPSESITNATGTAFPKFLKSLNVQTTFLSRATSMICGFLSPAWQFPMMMLPFFSA